MPLPGILDRKNPKSMWKIFPLLWRRIFPLCRFFAWRKYSNNEVHILIWLIVDGIFLHPFAGFIILYGKVKGFFALCFRTAFIWIFITFFIMITFLCVSYLPTVKRNNSNPLSLNQFFVCCFHLNYFLMKVFFHITVLYLK